MSLWLQVWLPGSWNAALERQQQVFCKIDCRVSVEATSRQRYVNRATLYWFDGCFYSALWSCSRSKTLLFYTTEVNICIFTYLLSARLYALCNARGLFMFLSPVLCLTSTKPLLHDLLSFFSSVSCQAALTLTCSRHFSLWVQLFGQIITLQWL